MPLLGFSALQQGTTTVTPVYTGSGAGIPIQPGSLLVAMVDANMATPAPFTLTGSTAGWTQRVISDVLAAVLEVEIWDKIAVGGDTMPTWNATTGTVMTCEVAEVSLTTIFDQSGTGVGVASPFTVTASGVDAGTGRVTFCIVRESQVGSSAVTFTDNVNGQGVGVGVTLLGDNSASSLSGHHHSLVALASPTGVSADNDVVTCTAGNHFAGCIASYYRGPIPSLDSWGRVPVA